MSPTWRIIPLAGLAALLLASSLYAQTLTVRVPKGNVRARPQTTSPIVGKVKKGEQYDVEARQGDWFKVLLETGQEGWVFKSLVEVSGKRSIGVVPSGPAPSASRPYEDSWAIVVGINRYRKPALRLHYAVNDAKSVTAALRKIGFPKKNIITLLDEGATARAIRTAFNTLVGKTRGQDRVFIFIAAHGMTLDRPGGGAMGYLLPVEADPANILGTAMPMSEVKDMASLLKAKHVFFAIDACFSGLLAARSVPRAEKRVDAAYLTRGRLRQILTAGERDQPVLEEGGHGLFTRRLLEAMEGEADTSPRDGVLTAMEVAAFVQGRVIASSSSRQTPFFGTMDGVGQFVFTAPGLGQAARPGTSDLARMRAKLEADRRKLEAEKARLERERLEVERKKLEAERKRFESEKKRLAALKKDVGAGSRTRPPPRPAERPKVAVGPGTPHQIGSGLDTMFLVPAGHFIRGSTSEKVDDALRIAKKINSAAKRGWFEREMPQQRIYLDAFYIDKYPVTNARFRRFGRPKRDEGLKFNGDRQPVVGVTWSQARDYCRSVGTRLPTEAEWEKAARGVDGRKYPWGNEWDPSKVIWGKNSGKKTHAVDRTEKTHRSPFGAVDMSGNVWEWVADWYAKDYYRNASERNPKGPASGSGRVIRGGSWFISIPTFFRAAIRSGNQPFNSNGIVGFRCAKDAKQRLSALQREPEKRTRPKPKPPRVAVGPPTTPHEIGSGLETMVLVPAGYFLRGSTSEEVDDALRMAKKVYSGAKRKWFESEMPQRRIYLDAFYIDKYPVTNARFRRFRKPKKDYGSKFNGARQPVVGVTWFQARDYCKSVGKRLPTEAEWEKAARGVDGRKYPWGNEWDPSKLIWGRNSGKKTHRVDRTEKTHRSPFGAVDMSGNVWEWVADWYDKDYYQQAPDRNPPGPASRKYRVLRGGSWYYFNTRLFRAANRLRYKPVNRDTDRSFRCAKAP